MFMQNTCRMMPISLKGRTARAKLVNSDITTSSGSITCWYANTCYIFVNVDTTTCAEPVNGDTTRIGIVYSDNAKRVG